VGAVESVESLESRLGFINSLISSLINSHSGRSIFRDAVSTVFALHTTSEKEEGVRRRQRKRLEKRLKRWKRYYTFDAGDAIVKSGYPLQEFNVVTPDGYHVQLQRIPNRGNHAVVFVHGVLDTSLTWVSQRIGSTRGSVAFAAYEAGLDVWLLNTRANWPQRNDVRKKSEFWRFSANELASIELRRPCGVSGRCAPAHPTPIADRSHALTLSLALRASFVRQALQDIAAQIAFVRRKKASEGDENVDVKAVGHSLGGACLLMYAVHKRLMGEVGTTELLLNYS
jgi:pimeloyl-ACP methyl ester carboxylesterase